MGLAINNLLRLIGNKTQPTNQRKQFKLWDVSIEVGYIVVVDVFICCILLPSMLDLKATQINVQYSIIL